MSQYFEVHETHPQQRLLQQAADIIAGGGLVVYPTDTTYSLGCHIGNKQALERLRALRDLGKQHHFTLTCRDLSDLGRYAKVDNPNYRVLKRYTPGPFTFVLPASREVPKRLIHPKRKTVGLRVPDNPICQGLLDLLGEPLMSSTMRLSASATDAIALTDPEEIRDQLEHRVDLIIDGGHGGVVPSTVVDLTSEMPIIIRQGLGEFG